MDAKMMIRRNPPNCRSRPSSLKGRKRSKKGACCKKRKLHHDSDPREMKE